MTTDTRTTNQNYPKPYPSNLLAADVVRIREALDAIDTDIAAANTAIAATITTSAVNGLITTAVGDLIAGSPAALDTLNELAAALGDDANFSATVTTALAARLQLAGGTMSGSINMGGNTITNGAEPVNSTDFATKNYADSAGSKGYAFFCGSF